MRISDWSSDVCSSDLLLHTVQMLLRASEVYWLRIDRGTDRFALTQLHARGGDIRVMPREDGRISQDPPHGWAVDVWARRSEEHTSELQSLMRISYAVFCLKKKNRQEREGIVGRP